MIRIGDGPPEHRKRSANAVLPTQSDVGEGPCSVRLIWKVRVAALSADFPAGFAPCGEGAHEFAGTSEPWRTRAWVRVSTSAHKATVTGSNASRIDAKPRAPNPNRRWRAVGGPGDGPRGI